MSTDDGAPAFGDRLANLPSFDISHAFDDTDDPIKVIVYADMEETMARWISIDIEYAVDLDEVA